MRNLEKYTSVIAVVASVISLAFFSLESITLEVSKSFLIGAVGSIIGAFIAIFLVRLQAKEKAPSIFISYQHKDKEFARKIAKEMQTVSGHVWLDDQEINVGDSIKDKVELGLKESDYFLIIVSEGAKNSYWAEVELKKAIELGKTIFPIKIDNSEMPDIIASIAYADLHDSFDKGMEMLKKSYIKASHKK